jgi:diguanylate cyclase (GGDEF)-like protein
MNTTHVPSAHGAALAPVSTPVAYGQLLRALLPAAEFLVILRGTTDPLCASPAPARADLGAAAAAALDHQPDSPYAITAERVALAASGQSINAFRLHDRSGHVCAVAVVSHPTFFGERPLPELDQVVRPALECLSRDLALSASLGLSAGAIPAAASGIPLLLSVAEQERGLVCQRFELARFVEAALQQLRCAVATLIVPDKSIAVLRRREATDPRAVSGIVTRSHRHLLNWAVEQGRPLVVNSPTGARRLPDCRILSVRVRNASGRPIGFLAFFREAAAAPYRDEDVRLAEALADRTENILQCNYDNLTGLSSRSAFERDAEATISQLGHAEPSAVLYFDIDGMGVINEQCSMIVGDAVIRDVADTIKRTLPPGALTARLAGDRFAALIPGCTDQAATALGRAVQAAVGEINATGTSIPFRILLSCGGAEVRQDSTEPLAHALALAERLSKRAKASAAGRPVAATAPAQPGAATATATGAKTTMAVSDILAWLKADRFELHAQPILALGRATPVPRYEILLRGLSPDNRAVMPGKLLEGATAHGLMSAIDGWVIERSFRELSSKLRELKSRSALFSINLSPQSLASDTIPDLIDRAWRRTGIPADCLCFEIAESSVAADPERVVRVMHRLRRSGFGVALDDAGSRALTPTQITALPLSLLKIDGGLVRAAQVDATAASAIRNLVTVARSLNAHCVAVAVESDDLRQLMTRSQIEYGQGFAIGKPVPLTTVVDSVAMFDEAQRRGTVRRPKSGVGLFRR